MGSSALVATALIVTGATTVLALRSFAFDRLDGQVLEGLAFASGPGVGRDPESPGDRGPVRGSASEGPAPRVGSLQAFVAADGAILGSSYARPDGTEVRLTSEQVDEILSAAPRERRPVTVALGGDLGTFRVAVETSGSTTVIAGLSTQDVTAITTASVVIITATGAVILSAAVIGGFLLVRRSLRPLDRVAAVAGRVSEIPLNEGEVEIPDRVADGDTDPGTEVGRVGASLNRLLGHVERSIAARQESEERLRRFIADASHELRTPLATIRGYAQLSLREGGTMTEVQERSFDRIESESERMAGLVDDLLLLARLDAGQRLGTGTVELTMIAVDAVSDAHAADPARTWRIEASDALISVPGDENRIRQVVANLLRNARTHTPPGTTVTVSLVRDGADAVLRVRDDGPGVDPALRDRLFERFARADQSRNRDAGSTGLGLSIAQAIVHAHDGEITVESAPGRTVFAVRLPVAGDPQAGDGDGDAA